MRMIEIASGILGYPRVGARRELKWALERYWAGGSSEADLLRQAAEIRGENWEVQRRAGASWVAVGDFALYDHVLDLALQLGVIPERFGGASAARDLHTYFLMARGKATKSASARAEGRPLEMTKWFDTNYHYLVPELERGMEFRYQRGSLFEQVREAQSLGFAPRPIVLGPISFLLLAKDDARRVAPLERLPDLLPAYAALLGDLKELGVTTVQVDEPCLSTDLPESAAAAFQTAYARLAASAPPLVLATYFGPLCENLEIALNLPVHALHLDALAAPEEARVAARRLRPDQALSLGLIDGRNVWRADLEARLDLAESLLSELGPERLMISSTCSLLHVPVDVQSERELDSEIGPWLSFARQKLDELGSLGRALRQGRAAVSEALGASRAIVARRLASTRLHNPALRARLAQLSDADFSRGLPAAARRARQRVALRLPPLPTTTIGSFPQTAELRELRARHKSGQIAGADYEQQLRTIVDTTLARQEELGLDVLVHGEAERNDMVEYFGELLEGMLVTAEGWVQSYGSRCVKPPILFGDVERKQPMTVRWASYAQSRSRRPVKGMLTGPVTMLKWSFVRDDEPLEHSCRTLALALRAEVTDLEAAGIAVIQVDEPAFREALPLRKRDQAHYLDWSVASFRLATAGVRPETQIHTHMCYSEFSELVEAIRALDADVISLEAARSAMDVAEAFARSGYDTELGLGIWDIHSPRVPAPGEMLELLGRALSVLDPDRVWVNPDCGLKTRSWDEVMPALGNMVQAARIARERLARRM
ncbi:MAG TPA: 5-methyltetrahydropteroyltriglutamate--homocysteine S-methyltransferase [Polyangiaceae bacterium]|nr:5-methyltetrahydropteroyltriglutamate--homocysteine S-methyltransferase [Polyangiaceae bacterium]